MNARAPYQSSLRDAQAASTRRRILEAVAAVLERGEEPTYALVAAEAGCQERTVYRHFPAKDELARAFWEWQDELLGPRDRGPASVEDLGPWIARNYGAFDERPELVRAMLHTRHGRAARLSERAERQSMTLRCVDGSLPGLDRRTRRRVAAATHVLYSAGAWELLRDHWDMDGAEAAETMGLALTALYEGVRRRAARAASSRRRTAR
jgi:AcrR family transcriptional regulator